ncbi:hypothetical protein Droror1_Dr00014144 [Drosera rotundifolia]
MAFATTHSAMHSIMRERTHRDRLSYLIEEVVERQISIAVGDDTGIELYTIIVSGNLFNLLGKLMILLSSLWRLKSVEEKRMWERRKNVVA